jgi:hypothetical protein
MLNSSKALANTKKAIEKVSVRQLDYISAFNQNAQITHEKIERQLASRFPDESIHWNVETSVNNLEFSAKLVDIDDYGRYSMEVFASEIGDIFKGCFADMSTAMERVSDGQGSGFGA